MTDPSPPFVGRLHHPGFELPLWLVALASEDDAPSDHLRLLCLRDGGCTVQSPGEKLEVAAPALLLLGPGDSINAGKRSRGVVLRFHPAVINGFLSVQSLLAPQTLSGTVGQDAYLLRTFFEPRLTARALGLDGRLDIVVRSALANIVREGTLQRDDNWPCRTRSYLIELLFHLRLALEQATPATSATADAVFDRALLLIHEKLAEKFSVPELARWCGTNRSSLNAAFRAQTGRSVHAHVMQVRMEVAATLLRDTGLPVAEILLRVGYENPSHFSRQFRALLGVTPGAYRATHSSLPGRRQAGQKLPETLVAG